MTDQQEPIDLGRIGKEPITATKPRPDTVYFYDTTGKLGYALTDGYTLRRQYRPEDRLEQRRSGTGRGSTVQLRLDQYMN